MHTPPDDLTDDEVGAALTSGWGLTPTTIAYAPVGFGDHHWLASVPDGPRLFLTAGRPGGGRGTAFRTAEALRHEAGLEFVVAPIPNLLGGVLWKAGGAFTLSVTTWREHASDHPGVGPDVVALIVALHGATDAVRDIARFDGLAIEARAGLDDALASVSTRWDGGPCAEGVRAALGAATERLRTELAAYDERAARVDRERFVVTPGELKPGNLLTTPDGIALVDWDTALLAPPERDLWRLDAADLAHHASLTGRAPDEDVLRLYRDRWDLTDIALYVTELRSAPRRTEDTETAWRVLRELLAARSANPPARLRH